MRRLRLRDRARRFFVAFFGAQRTVASPRSRHSSPASPIYQGYDDARAALLEEIATKLGYGRERSVGSARVYDVAKSLGFGVP
ncbi:MAG: hypothetical protein IPK13_11630 [Deltaproteobacteria bacterium]|nr:hypothetical protein [Deltaproteobacteria bacterium]